MQEPADAAPVAWVVGYGAPWLSGRLQQGPRGLPDMATIRMADPDGSHVASPPFFIGDEIQVRLGKLDAASPAPVFAGEIVTYEPEFSHASALICVRAYDKSHRMHRNRRSATYQDMTVADVVKKVAGENGLPIGTVEATGTVHKFLQQSMETDLDFLTRLAATENCEVGMADGKVFLEQVGSQLDSPVLTLFANYTQNSLWTGQGVLSFGDRVPEVGGEGALLGGIDELLGAFVLEQAVHAFQEHAGFVA